MRHELPSAASNVASHAIAGCRACRSGNFATVFDLGLSPLAERLLDSPEKADADARYPLRLVFCRDCALVQITENVPLDLLYGADYPYYTSVSPELVEHFVSAARSIAKRKTFSPGSLVVEIASNDGCQLQAFKDMGARVLGIDPAPGPVRTAQERGIDSLCRFFDTGLAGELRADGVQPDVLVGNNVLNLFQDPRDARDAIDSLLAPDGLLVLEVPYLVDTIDLTAFDNVYHQNATYWTLTSLDRFLRVAGLFANAVERIPTFGGSLRVYVERREAPEASVVELLAQERRRGVHEFSFYSRFAERVELVRTQLRDIIAEQKAQGFRIVAYGAAGGMATTLLGALDLGPDQIDYAVDINPYKHGRFTAGTLLEIHPPSKLIEDRPEFVLLLAWNFASSIIVAQREYRELGGRFIVPLPVPQIV